MNFYQKLSQPAVRAETAEEWGQAASEWQIHLAARLGRGGLCPHRRCRAGIQRTGGRVNMFVLADANNFYASCETVFRPELRGRPFIVVSNNDLSDNKR
jgi:DNA polymerase V